MNKLKFFLLILILSQTVFGKFYLRYNHLGYAPERTKQLIILSEEELEGKPWWIKNEKNEILLNGMVNSSLDSIGPHTSFKFNYKVDFSSLNKKGNYLFEFEGNKTSIKIKDQAHSFIPSDVLRYFRVQRSGTKHTLDHKSSHGGDRKCVIHRREAGQNNQWQLLDPLPKRVNMKGGWYDAGDYIKFTLTTAYATYFMLLSYEMNPNLFQTKKYSKTEYNDLLDEASWGLEYLMKTFPKEEEFIIQVGGFKDHQQEDRLPEYDDLNGFRECYSAFSPTQMGYTAAALALGAKVFQKQDSIKANSYLAMAESIYKKAVGKTNCAWVKQGWETFYPDKTPYDNMHLASVELYRTTKKEKYLVDAKKYAKLSNRAYWYSWGSLDNIAHLRFYEYDKEGTENYTIEDLNLFQSKANDKNNIWGVPHDYTWGSLYSFLGVGNLSMLYKLNTSLTSYDHHYLDVLDYTLGRNNWGVAFVASEKIPNSIRNVFSQIYKLQPKRYPTGSISEGPGDRKTHEQLKKYFKIPRDAKEEKFNTSLAVFYDLDTDFQTMETTIVGLADGLFFFTLIDLLEKKNQL